MRVKALQLAFIAALVLGTPCGFAAPTKKVAHKASSESPTRSKAKTVAHQPRTVAAKHASIKPAKPVASNRKSEPKVIASRTKPLPVQRRPEPAPVPEHVEPQDSIQVTHDRKQHHSVESATPTPTPRKATSADFLSSFEADRAKEKAAEPMVVRTPAKVTKPIEHQAAPAVATPVLFTKRGRLIVPPAMKGSHEILLHQNEMADRDGLDRVRDDADLEQMREDNLLVAIPVSSGLVEDERLPLNRRYCRPWTAQFLTAMSRAFYLRFHSPLQVNSAVRTVEFQQRLQITNGNAAPAEGETASPHLTGQAVDLAKHGLSMTQIAWIRGYLLPLVQAGKVDVEEEFQQACFHISVYRNYVPQPTPKREILASHQAAGATLATAIR